MKVRKGFVSNSSSSSFVIAFPKEPESFEDVYEAMFGSKEGGISIYDNDGMSHTQIAQKVWDDIKTGFEKETKEEWEDTYVPATEQDIAKEFSHRYHYWSASSCVHIWQAQADEIGGQWSDPISKYYGSDKDTLIELRDHIVRMEKKEKDIREQQRIILENEFKVPKASYAYKGGNHYDGDKEPYTDEEVTAYDAYSHAEEEFKREHETYVKLGLELNDTWGAKYAKEDELRKKLGKADAHEFVSDNKDAFFAILSYSDNDGGWGCTMEHGKIFSRLPCVTISHH